LRPRVASHVPWHRTLLRDEAVELIAVPSVWRDEAEFVRMEQLFPEAVIGILF
jgi:hypothetical protein